MRSVTVVELEKQTYKKDENEQAGWFWGVCGKCVLELFDASVCSSVVSHVPVVPHLLNGWMPVLQEMKDLYTFDAVQTCVDMSVNLSMSFFGIANWKYKLSG